MRTFGLAVFLVCLPALSAQAVSGKDGGREPGWGELGLRQGLSTPGHLARETAGNLPDARELEELLAREAAADPEDLFRLGLAYESDAFWDPDYKKAFSYFQRSEALGYPYAKAQVGYYYETGLAGPQDYQKAVAFYQQGADFGDSWAGLRLGYLYMDGLGVRKTEGQAFFWIQWASQGGVPEATAALGWLHEHGIGTEIDIEQAASFYRQAGDEGMSSGWVLLGLLHEGGLLGDKDLTRAVELYRKAAEADNAQGKHHLGTMYYWGLGIEQDQEQAVALFRVAAEDGYATAHVSLGLAFEQGAGVAQDFAAAADQYQMAIDKDRLPRALGYLGWLHAEGLGVGRDLTEAKALYEEAAKEGDPFASTELGLAYVNGHAMTGRDVNKGRRLLQSAAEKDHVAAVLALADMYERGVGVATDSVEAARWYEQAVALGDAEAMSSLGDFYERGIGVEQDFGQAFELYQEALDLGHQDALLDLGVLYSNDEWPGHDFGKALDYLEDAHAAQVDAAAIVLAIAYFDGDWLTEDLSLARTYFQEAADNDYWLAAAYLGYLKEEGYGGPREIKEALRSYEAGAEGGNLYSAQRLVELYSSGGSIPEDPQAALKWQIRAGELGDAAAAFAAAERLYDDPVNRDLEKAVALYKTASQEGNLEATVKWAKSQILGHVSGADFNAGLDELHRIAAEQPLSALKPLSQLVTEGSGDDSHWQTKRERELFLGLAYGHGVLFPKDPEKAETHLRRAIDMQPSAFPEAQYALAQFLFQTKPETESVNAEIVQLATLAANRGQVNAQLTLGQIYGPGTFTWRDFGDKDPRKALLWYKLSAAHFPEARRQLALAEVENWTGKGEIETGLALLEDLAEEGNADAASTLGRHYSDPANEAALAPEKALLWYEKSGRLGRAEAYIAIAMLHDDELLPGSSAATSLSYLLKAAEAGSGWAAETVGWRYQNGQGVEQDVHLAEDWYLRAIEAGAEGAEKTLATLYVYEDEFDPGRKAVGIEMLTSLAASGNSEAMLTLSKLHIKGEVVPKDVDRALELLRQASAIDPELGHLNLGVFHFFGENDLVDYEKAFHHFQLAAEHGNAAALNALGWMYHNGLSVAQDHGEAARLYEIALGKKNIYAYVNLGMLYRDGSGVPRNHDKAVDLFKQSMDRGYPGGAANMGWMMLHGWGVPQEVEEGLALIRQAADEEDGDGAFYLANLLETGDHMEKDLDRAIELYRIAAENGDILAREALERLGASADTPQGG